MRDALTILKTYGFDCNAQGHNAVPQKKIVYSNPEPDAEKVLQDIIDSLDPWTSVEEGLPEGDIKMEWLVALLHHGQKQCKFYHCTGDALAKEIELINQGVVVSASDYQPITPPKG